jgi:hypothetical protein
MGARDGEKAIQSVVGFSPLATYSHVGPRRREVHESDVVEQHRRLLSLDNGDVIAQARARHAHRSAEIIELVTEARLKTRMGRYRRRWRRQIGWYRRNCHPYPELQKWGLCHLYLKRRRKLARLPRRRCYAERRQKLSRCEHSDRALARIYGNHYTIRTVL